MQGLHFFHQCTCADRNFCTSALAQAEIFAPCSAQGRPVTFSSVRRRDLQFFHQCSYSTRSATFTSLHMQGRQFFTSAHMRTPIFPLVHMRGQQFLAPVQYIRGQQFFPLVHMRGQQFFAPVQYIRGLQFFAPVHISLWDSCNFCCSRHSNLTKYKYNYYTIVDVLLHILQFAVSYWFAKCINNYRGGFDGKTSVSRARESEFDSNLYLVLKLINPIFCCKYTEHLNALSKVYFSVCFLLIYYTFTCNILSNLSRRGGDAL